MFTRVTARFFCLSGKALDAGFTVGVVRLLPKLYLADLSKACLRHARYGQIRVCTCHQRTCLSTNLRQIRSKIRADLS